MQVSAKKLIAINFCILLFLSIGMYALAQTPTSTVWISSGVYPGAPSYTVWREGSNYFAKDAFGQIDFSGTNGTEVINNALSGGYVSVHLVANTEFVIDAWLIISNNTVLSGSGWSTIIKLADGTNTGMIRNEHWGGQIGGAYTEDYNIVIQDLAMDGNKADNTIANDGAISLRGVYNVLVDNVYIKDFNGFSGIYVAPYGPAPRIPPTVKMRIINSYVEGCTGTGSYGAGIFITGSNQDSYVAGNVFHNNRYGAAIEDNVEDLVFTENIITNSSVEGIAVVNSRNLIISHNIILYTEGWRGIILANGCTGVIIIGNRIEEVAYSGILIQTGNDNNTVTNNIIRNAGIVEVPSSGMGIDGNGSIITGNWVTEDTALYMDYGLGLSGSNNIVLGNHFEGATMGIYNPSGTNIIEHNYNITITW